MQILVKEHWQIEGISLQAFRQRTHKNLYSQQRTNLKLVTKGYRRKLLKKQNGIVKVEGFFA